jgi:hypothetical protein
MLDPGLPFLRARHLHDMGQSFRQCLPGQGREKRLHMRRRKAAFLDGQSERPFAEVFVMAERREPANRAPLVTGSDDLGLVDFFERHAGCYLVWQKRKRKAHSRGDLVGEDARLCLGLRDESPGFFHAWPSVIQAQDDLGQGKAPPEFSAAACQGSEDLIFCVE